MAERTSKRARARAADASAEARAGSGSTDAASVADAAESPVTALDPSFRLTLPSFEGPLDLLLHLIQKHELDILDLPIAFVVERYLHYLTVMENLDLDIASEYLVMAATLAHIKSKMLLPPDPSQADDEAEPGEEIDPRAELIRRLLEYQKYKDAAEQLLARGVAGRDVFMRGMEAPEASGPAPLASIGLFKLLDAFHAVLKRANQEMAFEITAEGVSIQDRMSQLTDRLRGQKYCTFDDLFEDVKTVYEVVVTFLAILEMAKRRLARVYQADVLAPIHLELLVSTVEEFDEPVDEYGGPVVRRERTELEDEGDETVARPGEDPLGEVLDPAEPDPHDALPPPDATDDAAIEDDDE